MKEFDVLLPLTYNDGTPVEARKFQMVRDWLLEHFDGLLFFPQPYEGWWKQANVTYRDDIVIYRVLSDFGGTTRKLLKKLKRKLLREFRQKEILIVERDVRTL